jgi:hypothetical protein
MTRKFKCKENEIITIKYANGIISVRLSDLRTNRFVRIIDNLNDRIFDISIEPSTTIIIEKENK